MKLPGSRRPRARATRPRVSQRRPERRTLLVVCEGRETERNYLDGLKREDAVKRRFTVTVAKGQGGSRRQIVQRAVDRKDNAPHDFDEVWCVIDVESEAAKSLRGGLSEAGELAGENGIELCLSNPAVEVWFLAHFVRTSRPFADCHAVELELTKHWQREFGRPYAKNDARVYPCLSGKTDDAIRNARAVRDHDHGDKHDVADCNSSTDVDRLVGYLLYGSRSDA
jgi:hypothetical protein